jgi:hypothetical protein
MKLTGVGGPIQRSPRSGGVWPEASPVRQLGARLMSKEPSREPSPRTAGSSSGKEPSATNLLLIGPIPPAAGVVGGQHKHKHAF